MVNTQIYCTYKNRQTCFLPYTHTYIHTHTHTHTHTHITKYKILSNVSYTDITRPKVYNPYAA